ncbi:MAG: CarD family transcriptional regulator [Clostridium sp.]|uniref:CarD family transcriptional regulator n=1 Tax=Clostridium sp. TaxID=1506 RepID=UPI002FCB337C
MLYIGDKVFYPNFGAGVVVNIEEKEVYGNVNRYYVIKLLNDIVTMVPINNKEAKGIRKCVGYEECRDAIKIFSSRPREIKGKWLDRYKLYTKTIKQGDFIDLCIVLNDMIGLKNKKNISKSEEKFFNDILDMVSEEVSLVLGLEIENVREILASGGKLIIN